MTAKELLNLVAACDRTSDIGLNHEKTAASHPTTGNGGGFCNTDPKGAGKGSIRGEG